jgi:signal transduction histidine kinase
MGIPMVVSAFEKNQARRKTKRKTKATGKKMTTKMTAIHKVWRSAAPGLLGTIGLVLVTLICFRLQAGLATAALLYLMIVVLVSLKGSFISSVMVSVLAVGCLDYFFTTPLFSLGMNDLPSYVALAIFLTVSLIITRLVSRVRKQAEEALLSVSHRVIEAEEQERHRIASDLHEDIGQRLTLLSIVIEQLEADPPNPAVDVHSRLDAVRKETLGILTDVKALAHELHSPRLEYLGIAAVMSSFCREYGERKGVEIDFRNDGLPSTVPPDISLCLFRVLQETVHNAVQHSGVRKFDVQLEETSDAIHLTVSDSGVGFNLEAARKDGGLGLNRMQERLKLVKGSLSIDSQPKRGTTIHARVPFTSSSHSALAAQ